MSIVLTEQQQEALDRTGEQPAKLIDPRTNRTYVLVTEQEFENVRDMLEEDARNRVIRRIGLRNAAGRMQEP